MEPRPRRCYCRGMEKDRFQKAFVVLLVLGISTAIVLMLRPFLLTILMAAIMAGVVQPLHRFLLRLFRARTGLASMATLLVFLSVVLLPLLSVLGLVATQAYEVSQKAVDWVQGVRAGTVSLDFLRKLPFAAQVEANSQELAARSSQVLAGASRIVVSKLSSLTVGTVQFVFQLVVFLYSLFFFLKDGAGVLKRILYYLPLSDRDEQVMLGKFVSVGKAMLKGTFVIALLQGTLIGLTLALLGIQGALFWGTLAVVGAMIPGVGTAFVWIPAAIYLFATHHTGRGLVLVVIGAGVVGTLDNFLRPRLVGRDTQMHDLLIFFGTLGGLFLFGLAGLLVGPILMALFVTIWDIYGEVFRDSLPLHRGSKAEMPPLVPEPPPPEEGRA
ncbi:MAG TPA: AI-2E family transporter [Candidatus Krumholzibacteria bacterium]|nr:AI-2E family transporter [Candidatus Krumholzibacteria bacterium]